jgi:hypothetical protein
MIAVDASAILAILLDDPNERFSQRQSMQIHSLSCRR